MGKNCSSRIWMTRQTLRLKCRVPWLIIRSVTQISAHSRNHKKGGLSLVIAGAIDIHYMDSLRILGNVINIVKPKLRKGSIGSWMKRTPQDSAVCTQTHLVCFENPGDLWDEGVVWVGVAEERADWEQHLRYGQRRWPLRPQYVEADRAVWVYVRVVYARRECHLQIQTYFDLREGCWSCRKTASFMARLASRLDNIWLETRNIQSDFLRWIILETPKRVTTPKNTESPQHWTKSTRDGVTLRKPFCYYCSTHFASISSFTVYP